MIRPSKLTGRLLLELFPIPSGFWEEMARLDSLLELHYESMDSFLPNEDWVCRRMDEGNTPWLILRRYIVIYSLIALFHLP